MNSRADERVLPPGSTIGILGGGQLGRMLSMAAARLGFRTHVFCPDPDSPAFDVAAETTIAAYEDEAALESFARGVGAVTYEFENIDVAAVRRIAKLVPVRPGERPLEVSQDRLAEKTFLRGLDIDIAAFMPVDGEAALAAALQEVGAPAILKTRRFGYDGKGQALVGGPEDAAAAFAAIGRKPAIVEEKVAFAGEISIIAVRSEAGEIGVYDAARNIHSGGILRTSTVPAGFGPRVEQEAGRIAGTILAALDHVGVIGVEFFVVVGEGSETRLLVNEFAPRVHNSGHWTEDACAVSQFENHIRAVAGWPLGPTIRRADVVMTNLIGEDVDAWPALAGEPDARFHLYGKRETRTGRKMGHVNRLHPLSGAVPG